MLGDNLAVLVCCDSDRVEQVVARRVFVGCMYVSLSVESVGVHCLLYGCLCL
jgi:hypothetical protein